MDGLDLLKQHWNNDNNFPKVDKKEIKAMLHRNSSSVVKWIFLISVIELSLGLALNFTVQIPEVEKHGPLYYIGSKLSDIIFYPVIFYFIYSFFNSYRQIKNTTSTKVLLETILKTRQHVNRYIQFNIYYIIFSFAYQSVDRLIEQYQEKPIGYFVFVAVCLLIAMSIVCWLFLVIVRLYYKVLYRRLVKKLDKNYEELQAIGAEEND